MRDHTLPDGQWEFDEAVTAVFGDMLGRSIPQYETMRNAVTSLADKFAGHGDTILDIGCSNGLGLERIVDRIGKRCDYIGVEISDPMLEQARERLPKERVSIYKQDLRFEFPDCRPSVILSVLTLMFIPIEYRQQVLANCYERMSKGGALIIVEKILGETADLNNLYVTEYLSMKARNGYSREEIDRKRYSLEGVLVPLTAKWNEQMLRSAGFRYIDCFWRWMNFAGWVAIK
jgi:tRNA (cmo5U34)-methyltransferase